MHLMKSGKTCGFKDGHKGQCLSVEVAERRKGYRREYYRERLDDPEYREQQYARNRKYVNERYQNDPEYRESHLEYARERIKTPEARERRREYLKSPKGREAMRRGGRRRRERLASVSGRYADFTYLDSACYLCDGPLDSSHVEHVVPLARFNDFNDSGGFTSATRLACASCNLSKNDRDPAEFILARWRAGLPVRQASTVSCDGCPIPET